MGSKLEHSVNRALTDIRQSIQESATRYSRDPDDVTLLAVSKTKPIDLIMEAHNLGHRDFGENYVDEAIEKIKFLGDYDFRWHFIGAIQSNKTKAIAQHFSWVHSIDREKIARRLSEHRIQSDAPLNCCIQLNPDNEATKAGVNEQEALALCQLISELPGLSLRGLMVIPAARQEFTAQRAAFADIKLVFDRLQNQFPNMDTLSMGMSGDMAAAIAEGSTMVRIGTALFGSRN